MNKVLFIVLMSLISISAVSQNYDINLPNEPIEQITVHTDRDLYLTGEKIWFKANCFVSEGEIEHNLSNVLYIELYNRNREYIVKRKFNISEGNTYGSIDIPLEFVSGNYFLRAYTQYLKNYQSEYYFTSLLTIIDPRIPLPETHNGIHKSQVEIIPQGGMLHEGITSNVVIKVDDNTISKLDKATILDGDKVNITEVEVSENGFGIFDLTPENSKNYFIQLILNNNDTIVEPIPPVSENGVYIKSKISSNEKLIVDIISKDLAQDYNLVFKSNNFQTQEEVPIGIEKELTQFTYPIGSFNKGVNYILLENNNGDIVSYHAFFNSVNEEIDLKINTQKTNYSPRELVELTISPENLINEGFLNVSVSVVKKGASTYPNDIPTHILNSPQILASYFNNVDLVNQLNKADIEILMTYFNKEIMNGKYLSNLFGKPANDFQWITEIRDVSISGVVFNKRNNLPVANIPVYISVFKENPQIHINRTNENGEFVFSLNKFVESQDIFLCAKTPRLSDFEIRINNDFSHNFSILNNISLSIDTSSSRLIEEMFVNLQAGKSFKTEAGKKQPPSSNFPFSFDEPQITIRLDDYVSTSSLETAIREFVPAVKIHEERGVYSLSITNNRARTTYHYPLILVDNIPIFNVNDLLEVAPPSIEKIDVYKYPLILGDNFINGTFILTTNTKDFGGIKMPKGSIFLEYQTISPSYSFEPQKYSSSYKKSSRLADFRNLLYWNPNLTINNETSVSFYTSDHCSEYDIIVRGVSKNGNVFYKKSSLKVSK